MGEAVATPFDIISLKLDKQSISARPIEWNAEFIDGVGNTADGSLAVPTMFEAVCPYCSQMIHFRSGLEQVKCPECGKGQDVLIFVDRPFQDPGEYEDLTKQAIEDVLDEIDRTPVLDEPDDDKLALPTDTEDCADELLRSIEESKDARK